MLLLVFFLSLLSCNTRSILCKVPFKLRDICDILNEVVTEWSLQYHKQSLYRRGNERVISSRSPVFPSPGVALGRPRACFRASRRAPKSDSHTALVALFLSSSLLGVIRAHPPP